MSRNGVAFDEKILLLTPQSLNYLRELMDLLNLEKKRNNETFFFHRELMLMDLKLRTM